MCLKTENHTQRPDVREKMHLSYRQHWRHQQRSVSLTTENQVSRLLLSEIRWLWHRQGTSGCIKHRNSINIGERSIVMTVSVCQCLSVREHISGNARPIFTKFLCMFAMAVARSFSGGVAIRYVLPVLRMTSYLCLNQGNSTWQTSWRKHSPHAAVDLAINGAQEYPLWANGLTVTGLLFRLPV